MAGASTSLHIKGSESVSKAARDAAGGIEGLKNKVKAATQPMNDFSQTARMLLTGGGLVMGAREIVKSLADCEAAFIKLNPEMERARGSAKEFGEAWTSIKAAAGGIVSAVLSPFRAILIDVIDGITQFKAKAEELKRMQAATADYRNKVLLSAADYAKKQIEDLKKDLDDAKVDLARYTQLLGPQGKILSTLQKGGEERRITAAQETYDETKRLQEEANQRIQELNDEIEKLNQTIKKDEEMKSSGVEAAKNAEIWEKHLEWLAAHEMITREQAMEQGIALLRANLNTVVEEVVESIPPATTEPPAEGGGGQQYSAAAEDPQAGLLAGLTQLATEIRSINALINWTRVIADGFIKIIAPVADQILSPLIGILYTMGMTIGQLLVPVLNILAPVVQMLAESFVWFYNSVILPVGNFIIDMFTVVGNIFIAFANAVSDVIKFVTFGAVNLGHMAETPLGSNHLQAISLEGLTTTGAGYLGEEAGGGYGSSTTVQQVPDIYVYITVEGNVIGAGGPVEVGRQMVDAIKAYLGTGARVEFLQN